MMQKYTISLTYAKWVFDRLTSIVKIPLTKQMAIDFSRIMRSFADRMNVQLEHTAEKKCAIFESTLRLVMKQGFHGSPMSQIAQDAGVATGTIYHYFSSRDELIIELFKHCKHRIGNAMFKPAEQLLPYPQRFVAIWINLVNFYIKHPEVLSFMEQFFSSPYAEVVHERNCGVQMQNEMSNFLQLGIDEGHIRSMDINILSAAFIGTVTATAKRHTNGHYSFDESSMNEMVTIIWNGIKKESFQTETICIENHEIN